MAEMWRGSRRADGVLCPTRWRRRLGFAAAGVLVASFGVAVPAAAQVGPAAVSRVAGPARAGAEARSVTLVTGDRVVVPADGGPAKVVPGKGRERIDFTITKEEDHLVVVPDDAWSLFVDGKVDRRLFDVTTLIESGYDDAGSDDVPLLVSGGLPGARRSALAGAGAAVRRELHSIGGVALRPSKKDAGSFWAALTVERPGARGERALASGVEKVRLDGKHQVALDESVPQIGAPAAHAAGFDGTGVKVAVLDTGIDTTHPDLAGKVIASEDFTGAGVIGEDLEGHGTHVASTVAGSGAASAGQYVGVAPGVRLLNGRVCLPYPDGCTDSDMIAGMQWAAAQGADVVNMSIAGADGPELDDVEAAVDQITAEHGTLFVIAADNRGMYGSYTIGSPGSADAALTVGAVDKQDRLASLSSRGPRIGDSALKPDISAPGVEIRAAYSSQAPSGGPDQRYATMSGTSMATPHVTGSAAILKQEHPAWTAAQLKATLMGSAHPLSGVSAYGQGAGRVDVARAINTTLTADPPSVSYGQSAWPFSDLQTAKDVTFRNDAAAPVTLDLAVRQIGGSAGLFSLSADTVTVPAGGTASVRLTIDKNLISREAGQLTGRIAGAVAGSEVVTVPFAADLLPQTHRLTLRYINRDGATVYGYQTNVRSEDGTDNWIDHNTSEDDKSVSVDLLPGRYTVWSRIITPTDSGQTETILVQPRLDLSGDTAITLDARLGQPLDVTVPTSGAAMANGVIGYSADGGKNSAFLFFGLPLNRYFTGQVGPDALEDEFLSHLSLTFADPAGDFHNSPYIYHLGWVRKGEFITGVDKDFTESELARIQVSYGTGTASGEERIADQEAVAYPMMTTGWIPYPTSPDFTAPFTRTEYYSTTENVRWLRQFDITGQMARLIRAEPGPMSPGDYQEKWNFGPFGPGLQYPESGAAWASRAGNVITAEVPLLSDRSGNSDEPVWISTRTELYRDGERIADSDGIGLRGVQAEVPGAQSDYELRMETSRDSGDLSTRVQGSWTFQSQTTPAGTPTRLPLMVARFLPELDVSNRAPSSTSFSFPVVVERQPGSAAPAVSSVAVDVSYDDGATWLPGTVAGTGGSRTITVTHPAGDGYVSLRARVADTAGNTVDQTIIHAYRLGAVPPPPPVNVRAQYKVGEAGTSTNQIRNELRLVNDGDEPVALSDLKVRYWYTANGTASQQYLCDYAEFGCASITGGFTTLPSPKPGADTYLELSFTGAGTVAPDGGSTGSIQSRWHKADWSNYQQNDDYSFDPAATALTDSTKVTVYYKGQLVWGSEP